MKNPNEEALPAEQAPLNDKVIPASSTRIHWFSRVTESRFLFPVIAVLALAASREM